MESSYSLRFGPWFPIELILFFVFFFGQGLTLFVLMNRGKL